jgi:hypothetical protein
MVMNATNLLSERNNEVDVMVVDRMDGLEGRRTVALPYYRGLQYFLPKGK